MSLQLPKILKNFGIYVDGAGLVGKGESVKLPTLSIKTEEIRTGGLDGGVKQDMGVEPIEFQFTLKEYNGSPMGLWGGAVDRGQFTMRGYAESATGESMVVTAIMRGRVDVIDPAEAKSGQANDISFTASLVYYKLQVDGGGVEIDVLNAKRNGKPTNGGIL